ncbi:Scr1 family TA system antitoxin-like transcriptional regulator [Saccharopolyspora sp. 5N102]|uniref:helix-turn-helix domain-containing protein n=1 Tax=Saccharopolyspora sp. 5N102 TaxID=3375155 RepID=UPI0037AB5B2B
MAISPTVRGKVLAKRLLELRKDSGYTQADVAKGLDWRQSKVSRIEAREQSVSVTDAHALASFYGVAAEERDLLVMLARDSKKKGWWQSYGDLIPEWFDTFVGMEAEASSVVTYESDFVPGLLQTESYARATTRATFLEATPEEVERSVDLRMQRQKRLFAPEPLRLWAVMSETTLRRPVGGGSVLREQIDHILELTEQPNIVVQVMPFTAGGHPALGPFVLLGYAEEWHPDVVYLETQAGAQWVEEPQQVGRFRTVIEHLRAHALDPGDSVHAMRSRAGELDGSVRQLEEVKPKRRAGKLR